jgi:3-oxoacyl-[acyl-carrier protein] reductase
MKFSATQVLVTGASRGIGAAIADAFADAGAHVVGTATSDSGAQDITRRLADRAGRGEIVDVADGASVHSLFARLEAAGSLPEIVINNAGITRDNLLARMKDEEWDAVIETNLSSLYRVCKAASRSMMKARRGRIVNIGSVVGAMGNPGQSNYAATKAGMIGFTRALARELGARNITVNAVAPGFVDTDMTRALADAQREALLGQIPLKRLGKPADVAAAVLFLCSPAASYITGETLHVNGGMYMG